MTLNRWLFNSWIAALPRPRVKSVSAWCKTNVRLIGSARSETYDPSISPWTTEPLECAANGTRRMTFVKPVQSGGSAVGELAICYWLAMESGGDLHYYWQNDEKAGERWSKRVERILAACPAVVARISDQGAKGIPYLRRTGKWTKGAVQFPHMNFTMLGVNIDRNVASESVRFEVNEEIHDVEAGWVPGRLEQCYGRLTAFWNSVAFNISNAGYHGDQLHTAFLAGTQQHWEVKCPGCGKYHRLRMRWEDEHPELGGLRYDTEGARLESGELNASKLLPTIRYQMPCGAEVRDSDTDRRALSLGGRYGDPSNPGAILTERSYTLEAVSVDYIPWIELIKQKHLALRALRAGNAKPWFDYLRERECQFVKPEDRPVVNRVILSTTKKDRAGLLCNCNLIEGPHRHRYGALDRQKGKISEGEMPHWWGMIQDLALEKMKADAKQAIALEVAPGTEVDVIHILTVYEGKILTDNDAAAVMHRHDVRPTTVVCDSGWGEDTIHVYQFCLEHGFNAIKGSDNELFTHPDGSRRIFSPERQLCSMVGQPPTRGPVDEPQFFFYSRSGILNLLAWLRASPLVHYESPADVSKDYIEHLDSWSLVEVKKKGTEQTKLEWQQHKKRDDLLFDAAYCGLLMEMSGMIGVMAGEKQKTETL